LGKPGENMRCGSARMSRFGPRHDPCSIMPNEAQIDRFSVGYLNYLGGLSYNYLASRLFSRLWIIILLRLYFWIMFDKKDPKLGHPMTQELASNTKLITLRRNVFKITLLGLL
jgi:hypothetical protein